MKWILYWFFLLPCCMVCGQPADQPMVLDQAFDQTIRSYLDFDVPVISVSDLRTTDSALILDAREREEYEVSHLPSALHIGYEEFDFTKINHVDRDTPIVVYCSIGYRSEKIGKKLQEKGFTNISNLYGSIFEWVNQGYPVVDSLGRETNRLHTYNRRWSKWVQRDSIEKVW